MKGILVIQKTSCSIKYASDLGRKLRDSFRDLFFEHYTGHQLIGDIVINSTVCVGEMINIYFNMLCRPYYLLLFVNKNIGFVLCS